jgi:hypothetical protein
VKLEQFPIHDFRVENVVTLLKSANGCHMWAALLANLADRSQAESLPKQVIYGGRLASGFLQRVQV